MEQKLPTREAALALLYSKIADPQLRAHCLATEAILRHLARRLGEDEDLWGLSGLLHDLDLPAVGTDMTVHGRVSEGWLREIGFPEEGIDAIVHHNAEGLGLTRTTPFHHAVAAAEQITGLIRTTALVQPSRQVADVKVSSVVKRMKDKRFAANVDRESIRECQHLGLALEDFVALAIAAMTEQAEALGL